MALTQAQLPILQAAINAETDAEFVGYRQIGSTGQMAEWLNRASNPAFVVWRTSVSRAEILQNGFDWTRLDNLSVGTARVWSDIFVDGYINPSKANVRAGIDAVWKGTAPDLAVRAAVYVHCKRSATFGEKVFATGLGTDAAPGSLVFDGYISDYDVVQAVHFGE